MVGMLFGKGREAVYESKSLKSPKEKDAITNPNSRSRYVALLRRHPKFLQDQLLLCARVGAHVLFTKRREKERLQKREKKKKKADAEA